MDDQRPDTMGMRADILRGIYCGDHCQVRDDSGGCGLVYTSYNVDITFRKALSKGFIFCKISRKNYYISLLSKSYSLKVDWLM